MRCPKCSYISFDKVTSCVKCSADVTEVAHALNGTAFRPLGTFYLGTLVPDYAPSFATDQVAEDYSFDSGADELGLGAEDLDISMDALDDFGDVPDLPGDLGAEDFSLAGADIPEFDEEDMSLEGHEVPDMDLSAFESHAEHDAEAVEDAGFDDVPEFDLGGIELEDEGGIEMAGEALELEGESAATPDLSEIDLSLGEDELEMAGDGDMVDLGDLELEMEVEKEKSDDLAELPDLEF